MNSDNIKALTFDAFGTLVDVHTAEQKLNKYVDNPARISELWRYRVLAYRPLCNFIEYESHHEINKDALRFVFENQNIEINDNIIDDIASVYHDMEPFDDVYQSMNALRNEGYDLYILSNGDADVLNSVIRNADLEGVISRAISADEIQIYKPSPDFYSYAADEIDMNPDNIAHVAGEWADVLGGMNVGMRGVWVNRGGRPKGLRASGYDPDLITDTFDGITDVLI